MMKTTWKPRWLVLICVALACGGGGDGSGGAGGAGGSGGGDGTGGSGGGPGPDTSSGGTGGNPGAPDGGGDPDAGSGPGPAATYYPLKVGNWWKYRVTSPVDLPWEKLVTAERAEPVGGDGPNATREAIRMITRKGLGDMTINWQGRVDHPDGPIWVRYRETAYAASTMMVNVEDWWSPHRLRFDERAAHTAPGASFQESYTEYKRYGTTGLPTMSPTVTDWLVDAVDETVVVQLPGAPARTYPACIRVSHSLSTPGARKQFWFCRGIGKVKETGGQTEELIDHQVVWP
jgi:hypothetical protein